MGASQDVALEVTQNFGSGGAADVPVSVDTIALTTTDTKKIVYVTFPSISGKTLGTLSYSEFKIWLSAGSDFNSNTNSLGNQSGTLNMSEIQIYPSDIELPVRRRTPEESLQKCLPYLLVIEPTTGEFTGGFPSNTDFFGNFSLPAPLVRVPNAIMTISDIRVRGQT